MTKFEVHSVGSIHSGKEGGCVQDCFKDETAI